MPSPLYSVVAPRTWRLWGEASPRCLTLASPGRLTGENESRASDCPAGDGRTFCAKMERRTHGAELLMQILVWSSLSAAVTAFAGVLALMLLRPVLETRGT